MLWLCYAKVKASEVRIITFAKEKFPFTKFESQIILMTKNYFRYNITGRFHSLGLTAWTIACKINLHGESHCPQVNILRKPGVQLCERQDKSGNGKLVNFDQS